MIEKPKIVVLTPVKNEAWILPRFLATASLWADFIIIADQNSSDESVQICKKFEKVILIRNENPAFNEAERQILLIKTARELVPGPRILFALDADEILAANAPFTQEWQSLLSASPGTVFRFEKPELYPDAAHCIRAAIPQPLAFIDDNSEHKPKAIHSTRIPLSEKSRQTICTEIIVLHYAYTRPQAVRAKMRLYSVVENTLGRPLHYRLRYRPGNEVLNHGPVIPTPKEWLAGWEGDGIDMHNVADPEMHWQDLEVLSYFSRYGVRRFWMDDIWDTNWEVMRQRAQAKGTQTIPESPINKPPLGLAAIRCLIRNSAAVARKARNLFKG